MEWLFLGSDKLEAEVEAFVQSVDEEEWDHSGIFMLDQEIK